MMNVSIIATVDLAISELSIPYDWTILFDYHDANIYLCIDAGVKTGKNGHISKPSKTLDAPSVHKESETEQGNDDAAKADDDNNDDEDEGAAENILQPGVKISINEF